MLAAYNIQTKYSNNYKYWQKTKQKTVQVQTQENKKSSCHVSAKVQFS